MLLQRDEAPWYKQRWPWFLMAGPAIAVVFGIGMFVMTQLYPADEVPGDDHYKEGLAVNERLHQDHQASALGLRADVMRSDLNVRLLLSTTDQVELPATLVLRLIHPTLAGQDQVVEMTSGGAGFYDGKLTANLVGKWLVTIEDPAGEWRLQGKWQADSEGPLHLHARAKK